MKNEIIVRKMQAYCDKIQDYVIGYDYEKFISSTMVIEACVFNLLQIRGREFRACLGYNRERFTDFESFIKRIILNQKEVQNHESTR
jgi:uncharacterized protein with HEPN domain